MDDLNWALFAEAQAPKISIARELGKLYIKHSSQENELKRKLSISRYENEIAIFGEEEKI